mmetsp:Transcript_24126/g.40445  ORF Transcript_24126/g.40445 Transcript_24126/m.40445 type:complete len:297 (+) Transcript_24126:456-1346(+)
MCRAKTPFMSDGTMTPSITETLKPGPSKTCDSCALCNGRSTPFTSLHSAILFLQKHFAYTSTTPYFHECVVNAVRTISEHFLSLQRSDLFSMPLWIFIEILSSLPPSVRMGDSMFSVIDLYQSVSLSKMSSQISSEDEESTRTPPIGWTSTPSGVDSSSIHRRTPSGHNIAPVSSHSAASYRFSSDRTQSTNNRNPAGPSQIVIPSVVPASPTTFGSNRMAFFPSSASFLRNFEIGPPTTRYQSRRTLLGAFDDDEDEDLPDVQQSLEQVLQFETSPSYSPSSSSSSSSPSLPFSS